jgi:hypothetical protein
MEKEVKVSLKPLPPKTKKPKPHNNKYIKRHSRKSRW